jgi:hypothetical protein
MSTEKAVVLVDDQSRPRLIPSKRFTLALLVFFAFIVQYSQRVNLAIAIVCMVNKTGSIDRNLSINPTTKLAYDISRNVVYPSSTTTTIKPVTSPIQKGGFFQEKQFIWSEQEQQMLLGGYWAGYIFTQVPG